MRAYDRLLGVLAVCGAAQLCVVEVHAQEISRIEGRWRLNRTASFSPPGSVFRGTETRTYEDLGDGMVRAEFRNGDVRTSYRARHDGEQYRFNLSGSTGVWTIRFTPVDELSSAWEVRQRGVVVQQGRSSVSEDGNTYTEATLGGAVKVFERR